MQIWEQKFKSKVSIRKNMLMSYMGHGTLACLDILMFSGSLPLTWPHRKQNLFKGT